MYLLHITRALAWPVDDDTWVELQLGGSPVEDPSNDHDLDDLGFAYGLDCVGELATHGAPATYWWTNGDELFFRVRVNDTPWITKDSELFPASWNFMLETDGNLDTFEYVVALTGPTPTVELWHNDMDSEGLVPPSGYMDFWVNTTPDLYARGGRTTSSINDADDWFVDVRVPVESFSTAEVIGDTFQVAVSTGYGGAAIGAPADLCGSDDSAALGDLASAWSDPIGVDQDDDGLTDIDEDNRGTDKTDSDTDDDGLSDGEEVLDFGTEPLDCDSDGDGVADGTEAGRTEAGDDTDLAAGCFVPDADPTTTTDPAAIDTDGGGLSDGNEDRDANGAVDPWETDPNDPTDDVDSDGDGIADAIEDECGEPGPGDDHDGDGIPDSVEGLDDTDGDGIPDFCEPDDDGDGIPSAEEGDGDSDGDGVPDNEDTDSDDDGIDDSPDQLGDQDCDGIPDYKDLDDKDGACGDRDGDGVSNADEEACGSNPDNPDTDGDGVGDLDESCDDDEDCDQLPDRLDDETDPEGCDTAGEPDTGDTANECVGDAILCGGHYTGGSCDSTGQAAGIVAAVAGLAVVLRRRRRARSTWTVAVPAVALPALLLPGVARAETASINAQRFTPAFDSAQFIGVNDTATGPGGPGGGVLFNYADSPVVYRYDGTDQSVSIVDYAATFDLGVTYAWKPLSFALDVPLHLVDGELFDGQFSPGDVRLGARGELLSRQKTGFGLGLYGGVRLPTGNGDAWVGAASPEGEGGLALAVGKRWVASVNVGVRGGSAVELLPDLTWGTRLAYGAGVSVPVVDKLDLVAEFDGESSLDTLDAVGASPLEWRLGGRLGLGRNLVATAALGTGLTQGVGAPALRVIAGLGWVPAARPVVTPPAPVAPPPPQQNVVEVAHQGGTVIVNVQNGAGQPIAALVTLLGDGRKFTTGPDGIGEEKVPAGEVELSAWAEGYRPARIKAVVEKGQKVQVSLTLDPSRVMVLADRVEIRDKIFFEFDSAVITAGSFRILDDLAATLENHPEIELVEVQGHTDDQGAEDYNLKLSQDRAEAVRSYLLSQGIAGDRLVARGYGESQPLQPGTTEEAREVNRRVMFKILKGTRFPEAPPAVDPAKGPKRPRGK